MVEKSSGTMLDESPSSIRKSGISFRIEVAAIFTLFAGFLLLNFLTASRYTTDWNDEVLYSDPAVNLYLGNGFTSSAWPFQTRQEFWAGYVPLYQILLANWFKLVGFDIISSRALNYLLITLVAFLLWLSVLRLNLIKTSWSRFALVALVLMGAGITHNYRSGRVDCIGLSLLAFALLSFSFRQEWLRYVSLAFVGIFLPLSGLQYIAYLFIFSLLLIVYTRKQFIKEIMSLASGFILGFILIYIFYFTNGVLDKFIFSTFGSQLTITGQLGQAVLQKDYKGLTRYIGLPQIFFRDPSFFLLLLLAMVIAVYKVLEKTFKLRSLLSFGLAVSFCIPVGIFMASAYPMYYSWMAYIPLAICLLATIEEISFKKNRLLFLFTVGILFLACWVGFPQRMSLIARDLGTTDYAAVEAFVDRNVQKDDWIYCDEQAMPLYYSLKKKGNVLFIRNYTGSRLFPLMPERDKVTLVFASPDHLNGVQAKIGGSWKPMGDGIDRLNIQVYRRG